MSQYKRKPGPAKKIAILTFYWILELLPFFVFWTNPALTNMLNGVEKTAWLLWKKLQAELRWPLATFPVRVTSATVFWAAFFWGKWTFTSAGLILSPYPCTFFLFLFFQKLLWFSCCFWSPSFRRDENSILLGFYYFSKTLILFLFSYIKNLFYCTYHFICPGKKVHQSNSKWIQTDTCPHW